MNETIGITGGTGYIGFSLANSLPKSYNIKLLDIKAPRGKLPENVSYQKFDVRNFDQIRNVIEDFDLIFHTAIIQIPIINEQKKLSYEVNIEGTQNLCKAVSESKKTKGLILSGSWHTIGEKELNGVIDEEFGFRPDKVEDRARLYALSKIAQESIVRFYDEMTDKIFGIIRTGTVLGEGMPEKTAANIFIENGFAGKALTPFKNSMYRPMLYVDVDDVCDAYEKLARKILDDNIQKGKDSVRPIFNVYYPEPITIIDLAETVREIIKKQTKGKIEPEIKIVDPGLPSVFKEKDKSLFKIDTSKALKFFEIERFKSPKESIEKIVKEKINRMK